MFLNIMDDNQQQKIGGITPEYPLLVEWHNMNVLDVPWHWHEEVEFKYVLQGAIRVRTEQGEYEIREGEYLALLDGALLGSFVSEEIMFGVLCSSFTQFKPSFITVYFGENMDAQSKEKAESIISGRFPEVDVTVVDGGQPVYQYMISVE